MPSTPAAATFVPIAVVSSSSWLDPPTGPPLAVHIVGQVINNTPGNVTLVKIPITLKDGAGAIIDATPWTFATVNVLGPSELSPFEFLVHPVPTNYASFQTGTPIYTPATSAPFHTPLATTVDACAPGDPAGQICGSVTNNDPAITVDKVSAVLTYSDGGGTTVAQNKVSILNASNGQSLAPSETGHFSYLRPFDQPSGAATVAIAEPDYPVELNPAVVDVGGVNVGKSGQHDVSLKNKGSLPVTVSMVSTSNPEFSATTACPDTALLAGQTCHVTVIFTPAATGIRTGTLTITDDAAGNPQTVPLTGTGTAPHVTLRPNPLDFGNTERAGMPGLTKAVTLLNDGTGSLAIASVGTDNAPTFRADGSACPAALVAGTQCTIIVTFASNIAGPYSGNLVVTDDAGTGTQTLPLTAFASGPGDQLSITSIDFHQVVVGQTSPVVTVTLANNGNESLTISDLRLSGDFGKVSHCGSLPITLAANATCTVDLTFAPTQTGDRPGSLTVSDNTFLRQQLVSLTGKGVNSTLSFSPATLDFGTQSPGSSTVLTDTVSNQGSAPLQIKAITTGGDYSETDTCGTLPRMLQLNDSCMLRVTFKPTDLGTRSGTITITDNTPAGTAVLQLTGNVNIFTAMYTLDGYGGIHPTGGSAAVATTAYWNGWKIARSAALLPDGTGGFVLDGYGGLHNFGAAAPESASSYFGWDIARDVALLPSSTPTNPSGYTLDGWGGLHPFGGAPAVTGNPYWSGHDLAMRIVLLSDASGGGYVLDVYGGLHPFFVAGNAMPPAITNNSYWAGWRVVRGAALNPNSSTSAVSGVTLDAFGGVHPFNSAGNPGTVNPQGPYFANWDISRGIVLSGASTAAQPQGWVLDGWGGLHAFGGAPFVAQGAYWPNFDIGVQLVLR